MADTQAAIFLGDGGAEISHVGDGLPQRAVVGRLAVEHLPHRGGWTAIGQQAARLVLELLLVLGKVQVHVRKPFSTAPACMASWRRHAARTPLPPRRRWSPPARDRRAGCRASGCCRPPAVRPARRYTGRGPSAPSARGASSGSRSRSCPCPEPPPISCPRNDICGT